MWHSVGEALPPFDGRLYEDRFEESEYVLMYGKTPFGDFEYGIGVLVHDHEENVLEWAGDMNGYDAGGCNVTHWTELPEPPGKVAKQ